MDINLNGVPINIRDKLSPMKPDQGISAGNKKNYQSFHALRNQPVKMMCACFPCYRIPAMIIKSGYNSLLDTFNNFFVF